MNYGEVLSKSWKIIWKYKILWIFGILASCAEGSGGSSGGGGSSYQSSGNDFNSSNPFPELQNFGNRFVEIIENIPVWVWVLIGFAFLALIAISVFLGIVGRVGLIRGTGKADDSPAKLTFGELWSEAMRYFWRIFLLDLLYFGVGLAIALITIIPIVLIAIPTAGVGLLCLVPLLCLLVPLSWAIEIFVKQSYVALVNDDLGIMDAIKRAWEVFRPNLGHMAVMGLILFFGGSLVGIVISLPVIIAMTPLIIAAINGTTDALRTGILTTVIIILAYSPIAILLNGVLRSYIYAAWTLTYRRLTTPVQPAVVEVIETVPQPGF